MKVCVIGDSHCGALKRGWDVLAAQHRGLELTFFAAGGYSPGFDLLKIERGLVVSADTQLQKSFFETSKGHEFIDLNGFDIHLVYGLWCLPFFRDGRYISEQVLSQSMTDHFSIATSLKVVRLFKSQLNNVVYVGHNPLLSVIDDSTQASDEYMEGIELANKIFFGPMGCELIAQPEETVVGNRFTASRYSVGSKRFLSDKVYHDSKDRKHMNDVFGVLWLENFLSRIKS